MSRNAMNRVCVVVPVYAGLEESRRCIESLIASLKLQKTEARVIIVDDCSPEPALSQYCKKISDGNPSIDLLVNEKNLGFVKSVNRGMLEAGDDDVILLNSDTEVANDWIDRLAAAAYRKDKIATVTPFSNNATICSYPRFLESNSLPANETVKSLDKLFSHINAGKTVDLPTGHGFCIFIRRAAIKEIGLFDDKAFPRGYGEENDFCCRAHIAGWMNILACDVFVFHEGSVSFGAEREIRVAAAMKTIAVRYPWYHAAVNTFIEADPVAAFRQSVSDYRRLKNPRPSVLMINHGLGGGTQKHVHELARSVESGFRCYELASTNGKRVEIRSLSDDDGLQEFYEIPRQLDSLLKRLKVLDVIHVHFHHTIGLPLELFDLPRLLGVEYDFTAHDFFAICPQINLVEERGNYCGEPERTVCNACIKKRPAHGASDIAEWRAYYAQLLAKARHVYCPSHDTATRLQRYFYLPNIVVTPHEVNNDVVLYKPEPMVSDGHLVFCIIGALSKWKGADLVEAVAELVEKSRLPIRFVLIGFAYRQLNDLSQRVLQITGPYQDDNLDALIGQHKPHAIWFTSQWPETYSYTLSAALRTQCAIIAPDLGAFSERLRDRALSWVLPWNTTPASFTDFFMSLRKSFIENKVQFGKTAIADSGNYLGRYAAARQKKSGNSRQSTVQGINLYVPGADAPVYAMRVSRYILAKRVLRDRIIAIYRHEKMRPFLKRIVPIKWVIAADRWLSY
ncbi:MAG: glycosyltransferase [Arenimonas sp.]